jgi:hypothetical protein
VTEDWTERAAAALGITDPIDTDDILDMARVVAHEVERKMAPVSAFLAGLAAGKAGGDEVAMRDAIEKLRSLAQQT